MNNPRRPRKNVPQKRGASTLTAKKSNVVSNFLADESVKPRYITRRRAQNVLDARVVRRSQRIHVINQPNHIESPLIPSNRRCKSIFKTINDEYSKLQAKTCVQKPPASAHSNIIKNNMNFCSNFTKNIQVVFKTNVVDELKSHISQSIKNTNQALMGLVVNEPEEEREEFDEEPSLPLNFLPIQPKNWIYRTPMHQPMPPQKATECQLKPGMIYQQNNYRELYEIKENRLTPQDAVKVAKFPRLLPENDEPDYTLVPDGDNDYRLQPAQRKNQPKMFNFGLNLKSTIFNFGNN